jgi:short subunit fatty acids transporter
VPANIEVRAVANAGATARAAGGELVTLVLRLANPYAALASAHGGLSATAQVVFAAPGEPTLHQTLSITFTRTASASRKGKDASRRRHRRGAK